MQSPSSVRRRSAPRPLVRLLVRLAPLALALGACALIPPQTVQDPLGLDGMVVPLAPIGGPALGAQQARPCSAFAEEATHCASEAVGAEVPNIDDSGLGGIVARFETTVGTREAIETLELAASPGVEEPPESITLSDVVLDLRVEDVTTGASVHPEPFRATPAEPVTFERTSCEGIDGVEVRACRYEAVDTSPLDVEIAFRGRALDDLLRVLTGGGDNRLSGTIAYAASAEGGAAAGTFAFQVTLDAPTGTIRF